MEATTSTQTFHPFPLLPIELQTQIWLLAASHTPYYPYIHDHLQLSDSNTLTTTALLTTCRHSSEIYLANHILISYAPSYPRLFLINPWTDYFCAGLLKDLTIYNRGGDGVDDDSSNAGLGGVQNTFFAYQLGSMFRRRFTERVVESLTRHPCIVTMRVRLLWRNWKRVGAAVNEETRGRFLRFLEDEVEPLVCGEEKQVLWRQLRRSREGGEAVLRLEWDIEGVMEGVGVGIGEMKGVDVNEEETEEEMVERWKLWFRLQYGKRLWRKD